MSLPQSSVPSLVEVLKRIGRAWRSLYDQAAAMPAPDAEDSPKALLVDQYVSHPIYDLFRLIEEHTGIARGIIQQVAWRLNTPLGLEPFKRTRPPTDPELAGFFDDTKPDLLDLRPVSRKLNKCDVNGTTATILRRFEERHPGVLSSFGFIGQRVGQEQAGPENGKAVNAGTDEESGRPGSTRKGKQKVRIGAGEKSKESDRWLTVTEAERVSHIDKGVISRAADDGSLKSNGKKGRDRRIDALDLTRWKLERSKKPEPAESDRTVKNLVNKHVPGYAEVQSLRRQYDRGDRSDR